MCGRVVFYATVGMLCGMIATAWGGTVDISCVSGVQDELGQWLQGSAFDGYGDLIQIIYAGPDGQNDVPDENGNPTDDDVLLGTTFAGAGFPFNPHEGKFTTQLTHELLVDGAVIYCRAWNDSSVATATYWGDSELAIVELSGDFGSVDFPTWATTDAVVAVELVAFQATRVNGGVRLTWVTQSETENRGFEVRRATAENGPYARINRELIRGAGTTSERHEYVYHDGNAAPDTAYYYMLADIDFAGRVRVHGPIFSPVVTVPERASLAQNYPNPFNPVTWIAFELKEAAPVTLRIYNLQGQLVRTLVEGYTEVGRHEVRWDATDDRGTLVPSGVYVYVLESAGVKLTQTMQLVK
ncbi:MAG: T9SS type A sorting domain-containing protein [candidate division KSB1 bacterium]|nr:T9SS type A sorting domain-containing protein [candidate division KSB1 bacterium]